MKLAAFIREALGEIAIGVHAAKADNHEIVAIVPGQIDGQSTIERTYIDFDVAVTAETSSSTSDAGGAKGGVGIAVLGLKAELGGSMSRDQAGTQKDSTVSRITFRVPVYLNAHFRNDPGAKSESQFVAEKWKDRYGG